MSELTMDAIAGAGFRATAQADEWSQEIKNALGFGSHNIPARLAIARSLAVPSQPAKVEGEPGREIKGDTLFGVGADLLTWVSLLVEHRGAMPESMPELRATVAAHWLRGMNMLAEELRVAGKDASEFWKRLAESALPATSSMALRFDGSGSIALVAGAVTLPIGEIGKDADAGELAVWALNAPGGSPHSAFMGGVGSGKTRTATFMLRSLAQQVPGVPMIAFDFKGDLNDERNALDKAFGATVINPLREPIPLDVFALVDKEPSTIVVTAQRLCDSLSNLKESGYTAMQRGRLSDALEKSLKGRTPCTLPDVQNAVKNVYAANNTREDSLTTNMANLNRFKLFEPKYSPAEFFGKSWIISLPADVPELVRVTVVSLLTDALERCINSQKDAPTDANGNRALRSVCVIDEANRVLGSKLPGLANLIRLGRSKGAAVMLISQAPDDFAGEDDDFLSNMGFIACYTTTANASQVKRIFGSVASLAALKKGEALVKTQGSERANKVICWQ